MNKHPKQLYDSYPVPQGQGELFDAEPHKVAPPVEYEVLYGHHRQDGTYVDLEKLKQDYLRYTDDLIGQIDGTMADDGKPADVVIYLDKSARPVQWLVNEVWNDLARKPGTEFNEGVVPKKPKSLFLNIDRNQWNHDVDPENVGAVDVSRVAPEALNSLRNLLKIADNSEGSDESPFAGKKILIVDEVGVSGATLKIAMEFLANAAPESDVHGHHWMQPGNYQPGGQAPRNNDIPVWYRSDTPLGRGVDNRESVSSANSENKAQRVGRWFLSTRFATPDEKSLKLRKDLHNLGEDLRHGKVFFTPSVKRNADDFLDRATTINEVGESEFITRKKEQEAAEKKARK